MNSAGFDRAYHSLEGLSVGDAFGERFFGRPERALDHIARRVVPAFDWREGDPDAIHKVWQYTDDTMMAWDTTCAIVGGIVASYTGVEQIPSLWRQSREPLPDLED